jgi:hypothetical protein
LRQRPPVAALAPEQIVAQPAQQHVVGRGLVRV